MMSMYTERWPVAGTELSPLSHRAHGEATAMWPSLQHAGPPCSTLALPAARWPSRWPSLQHTGPACNTLAQNAEA